jgi:hypothetical protein
MIVVRRRPSQSFEHHLGHGLSLQAVLFSSIAIVDLFVPVLQGNRVKELRDKKVKC